MKRRIKSLSPRIAADDPFMVGLLKELAEEEQKVMAAGQELEARRIEMEWAKARVDATRKAIKDMQERGIIDEQVAG